MNPTTPTPCSRCGAALPTADAICSACLLSFGAPDADAVTEPMDPRESPPALPGTRLGDYQIEALLGRGGMGAVYAATHLVTGRRLALKVLNHQLGTPEARARFLREGRLAASINHPNSVYVFGTEQIHDTPVIAMELIAGGTLQQRVAEHGAMPVGAAVDAILDIIAGLEAAQTVGVLHRDVKPANCFIDSDGMVKEGDFGLSISTEAREDFTITQQGGFLGTPAFSSPEQLRGEALDVRSDIYAVGVTLFYLLTGSTPFEGSSVMNLLANVLDKPARDPQTLRPDLPSTLSQVVLHCLAKQAGDRFACYAELREALQPFCSIAPTPSTLGLRFVAGLLNGAIAILLVLGMSWFNNGSIISGGVFKVLMTTVVWLLVPAIVIIPEGLWGASLGMALIGLRVIKQDRSKPGIPRALARYLLQLVPYAFYYLLPSSLRQAGGITLLTLCQAGLSALYFTTVRRHNGYAALHDLLTGTRVIVKAKTKAVSALKAQTTAIATVDNDARFGPFQVLGALASNADSEVLLGFDPQLLRRVWIHCTAPDATPSPTQSISRFGRLRWLARVDHDAQHGDVYEAPTGQPLTHLLSKKQSWETTRPWLRDIAAELEAAEQDGTQPAMLSLAQLWVTAEGKLKLLDFPGPGAKPCEAVPTRSLLNQLAISALAGRIATAAEAATQAAPARLPMQARAVLDSLRQQPAVATVHRALAALPTETSLVPHVRRAHNAIALLVLIFVAVPMAFTLMTQAQREAAKVTKAKAAAANPDMAMLENLLTLYKLTEPTNPTASLMVKAFDNFKADGPIGKLYNDDPVKFREQLGTYISGRYGSLINDKARWDSPEVKLVVTFTAPIASEVVSLYPTPTAEAIAAAGTRLNPVLKVLEAKVKAMRSPPKLSTSPPSNATAKSPAPVKAPPSIAPQAKRPAAPSQKTGAYIPRTGTLTERLQAMAKASYANLTRSHGPDGLFIYKPWYGLAGASLAALIVTGIYRRGPVLRLVNKEVVDAQGTPASTRRVLLRSLLAWLPALLVGTFVWTDLVMTKSLVETLLAFHLGSFLVGVWLLNVVLPRRSIQDYIARTWLVPM